MPKADEAGTPGGAGAPGDARWAWLGRTAFAPTAELQERLRHEVIAGTGPETLLLLEHDPVVTLGRSARPEHVLALPAELAHRGITLCHASRGGDVTYHGPGQLVGYPIVRLRGGVVGHLRAMAAGLGAVLAELGITAAFRRDAPGLWVDRPGVGPAKICAFGVHVSKRVAIHGFALNVTTELDAFDLIVPCGLRGSAVTSIAALAPPAPPLASLAARVAEMLGGAYGVRFVRADSIAG